MNTYGSQQAKMDAYRQHNVMTASPGELTLMLYDGCIKEIKRMQMYIENGDIEKTNDAALHAQSILSELKRSLNMEYEMSGNLSNIYEFLIGELVSANIRKETEKTKSVLELLTDLRDTWQRAIRLNRQQATVTGGAI